MKTFGQKAFEEMSALRQSKRGHPITREEWIACMDAVFSASSLRRKQSAKPKSPPVARARNPLFDALALGSGIKDLAKLTKVGGKTVGTALSEIQAVETELTPEKITRVCAAFAARYLGTAFGPMAIAKHWAEFAHSASTKSARIDAYVEPAEDWRRMAQEIFRHLDTPWDFAVTPWLDISVNLREEILRKLYAPDPSRPFT